MQKARDLTVTQQLGCFIGNKLNLAYRVEKITQR